MGSDIHSNNCGKEVAKEITAILRRTDEEKRKE